MSEFSAYGSSDEEYASVRKHNAQVESDSDSFENWEGLIKAVETLDGGLNRNSSPQALACFRDAYDRFLFKFPLLFGYWKKYADLEFNIAGPEAAQMVYERGCASITHSVDLWTDYCSFTMDTTHDPRLVRDSYTATAPILLFERGSEFVGLDFLAHPFWDKYLEYEDRQDATDRVFAILQRIVGIPMHQYARYYERFRGMAHSQPLASLADPDTVARFRAEIEAEAGASRPELEVDRDVRAKIDAMFYDVFTTTQNEVSKRWTYESEIKRPYFHVTELEHSQLANWRKYLDFEEAEGDYRRVVCLYERCLVTCALYDEFWFRYARWMLGQDNKDEEVRNIYIRASTMFVPLSRPGIRLQWAFFEESAGRTDVALDIHASVLMKLPNCVEVVVSWANVQRRQSGLDAAVQVLKTQIDSPSVDLYTKGALVGEWASLVSNINGSADDARVIFTKNAAIYADSRVFWDKWFEFEMQQKGDDQGKRLQHIYNELRTKSRLSSLAKKELVQVYMAYLVQRGGKDAMKTFMQIDRDTFGPDSVVSKYAPSRRQNGSSQELDEISRARAETRYLNFYEAHIEPVIDAPGQADFN